jgi:tetratricopeptide (TPR) repeat protein
LLAVALIAGVVYMRTRQPDVPAVDTALETKMARARQLRSEADALVHQQRYSEAYPKYKELQRLMPTSPHVNDMVQKLEAMRQQEELGKQQLAQAQAKYLEGMTFLGEKKYPDAIAKFQEALAINPNLPDATTQMTLAQAEQAKLDAARLLRQTQRQAGRTTPPPVATTTTTAPVTQTVAPVASTAQITTVFTHPFTDGNIIVRIGADIVASEPLFTERRRRVFNTLVRQPRPISVSHEFPAKNADVQIWITVPQLKIQEHHNIPAVRFEPGGNHRLIVHYNATSKTFTYELN